MLPNPCRVFPPAPFRRIARLVHLVAYDLCGGKRTGRVSLEAGIHFDPQMDLVLEGGVWLDRNGTFRGSGRVRIGADTYLGSNFAIHAMSEVTIGRDCLFGDYVSLIDNDHGIALGTPMRLQPLTAKPISIGNDCWLGQNAVVLAGVSIGDGAIVAAGALVRSDVAPGAIVAGVPARFIRMRG